MSVYRVRDRGFGSYVTALGNSHVVYVTWGFGETWSLTLREERRLRVFENRVLRRVFGAKREEVTGEWRKLHNEELNPYPTAFPYGNGMVLHFYQQQESSTTKTVHKVINKGLKAYV